jgi:hypothetical protein
MAAPVCAYLLLAVHAACNRAVRIDANSAILDAFHSHRIIALGEGGLGSIQARATRPLWIGSMPAAICPHANLRRVWQDTTMSTPIWDVPIVRS